MNLCNVCTCTLGIRNASSLKNWWFLGEKKIRKFFMWGLNLLRICFCRFLNLTEEQNYKWNQQKNTHLFLQWWLCQYNLTQNDVLRILRIFSSARDRKVHIHILPTPIIMKILSYTCLCKPKSFCRESNMDHNLAMFWSSPLINYNVSIWKV